ncbi:hypothetical protein F5Y14DRAFT_458739 [Nemania sp. NC0429]|nr:hypothetical protein F5Y14DRAFT_458739 [Nemania sp. NC0429]
MRRRNSVNPRRLDRHKSTASGKSVHLEHILPETAERDAQVAATQAFARAQERLATDSHTPLWPPSRYTNTVAGASSGSPRAKERLGDTALHRQQSIRFVQERHAQLAPASTMASRTSTSRSSLVARHHIVHVEAETSSAASASGMVSATKGAAGDYIDTLFTSDEYYTPEDEIAFMPSSYRRLRKSRSLFTNGVAVITPEKPNLSKSSTLANQPPIPSTPYRGPPRGNENVPPRGLKAPKSMSFLRDFRDTIVPALKSEYEPGHFPFMNGHVSNTDKPKNNIRHKSSRFFRSRPPSQDSVLRKSMRDTSNNTVSVNSEITGDSSLRYKARRVSQGFKHKLKNLFGVGKGDGNNTTLPLQHIDAQRSHIFDLGSFQNDTDEELRHDSSADLAAISHVLSGVPSFHSVPSYEQPRSRQGSIESLSSEQKASDERSRVTSWSSSGADTVITYHSCHEERERKRLSVINENGTHVCSSSTRFGTISEQSNPSTISLHQQTQVAPVAVDGRRVYSALMKRIDQSQQEQISDRDRQCSEGSESSVEHNFQSSTGPSGTSSRYLREFGCKASETIRYVMPESESESESPKAREVFHKRDKDSLLSTNSWKPTPPTVTRAQEKGHDHQAPGYMGPGERDASEQNSNDALSAPSTTETEHATVCTHSSRSSAFFGSPTRHLFRTQSPFRRALRDRMQSAPKEPPIQSPNLNPWMRSLSNLPNIPMQRSSTYGSDADVRLQYTESIYSTNTEDDQAKRHSVVSVVEDLPRPTASTHGDVTIFVNTPACNKRSSSLPPKQRVSSSSSSVEWKTWLSSNVSKLEETTSQVDSNNFPYSLTSTRPSGHIRENAQINDDREHEDPDLLGRPPHVQGNRESFMSIDLDDDEEDDQPTPFDAGEGCPAVSQSILPLANRFPDSLSTSSRASPVTYPKYANHEKELPRVPSLIFGRNRSNGNVNITTKLLKRQPKANSMTPLTSRSLSGADEDQPRKTNSFTHPRRNVYGITPTKPENVSPAAVSDDDSYGIEGAGVLGPSQQNVGSKRIVDIFLSSRRRRMASEDDGNVFL